MITLYTFGPMFGLPDASPFAIKAEVLLKISGLSYRCEPRGIRGLRSAPKGKLPYMEENGVEVADSTFIRLHLEQCHGVNFDAHLTREQAGIAWACEKMLEDHLYWALAHWRWFDADSFEKGPARYFDSLPTLPRLLLRRMVRGKVRQSLHAHGLGRHTADEINRLATRAIDALANILGEHAYLMGPHACGADATAFAFVANLLCPHFDGPQRRHAERHANLVGYHERLLREFYSTSTS